MGDDDHGEKNERGSADSVGAAVSSESESAGVIVGGAG